jgi:hypothetical protein
VEFTASESEPAAGLPGYVTVIADSARPARMPGGPTAATAVGDSGRLGAFTAPAQSRSAQRTHTGCGHGRPGHRRARLGPRTASVRRNPPGRTGDIFDPCHLSAFSALDSRGAECKQTVAHGHSKLFRRFGVQNNVFKTLILEEKPEASPLDSSSIDFLALISGFSSRLELD